MPKIIGCGNEINSVYYSGYTIERIYACGGQLVYGEEPQVGHKLMMTFSDGRTAYLPCDSTSAITKDEVQKDHVIVENGTTYVEPYTQIVSISIGDCVKTIDTGAFSGMTNLERVQSYGENVESIGSYAFSGCTSLEDIYIGCNTKTIGTGAFHDCESVSAINICSGVETIGISAFRNITGYSGNIDIPASVTSIGRYAFYNMPNVSNFIIRPTTPPTLPNNSYAFHINTGTFPTAPLKVKVLSTYKVTGGWQVYDFCMQQL